MSRPRYTRKNRYSSPVENAATTRTTARIRSWRRRSTKVGPPGAGRRGDGWKRERSADRRARTDLARSAGLAGGRLDRGALHQLADDMRRADVVDRRGGLHDHPVGERRLRERLHVIRDDVVAAEEASERLAGAVEGDRAARAGAQVDVRVRPRRRDEPDDVVADRRIDVDLADVGLQGAQLVDGADLREVLDGVGALLLVEDDDLIEESRVAEPDAEHEAVELRLWERERALVLDRVLGRDDEERVGHRVGDAVDRRLPLLHALEEARLRLRRRAVDLVREDDLAHDRPGPELELLGLLVVDRQTGDVQRQEVRRELDSPERAPEAARDRLGEDRLAGARHVLDQQVATTHQRDQREAHLVVLPDDDTLDVGEDLVPDL